MQAAHPAAAVFRFNSCCPLPLLSLSPAVHINMIVGSSTQTAVFVPFCFLLFPFNNNNKRRKKKHTIIEKESHMHTYTKPNGLFFDVILYLFFCCALEPPILPFLYTCFLRYFFDQQLFFSRLRATTQKKNEVSSLLSLPFCSSEEREIEFHSKDNQQQQKKNEERDRREQQTAEKKK